MENTEQYTELEQSCIDFKKSQETPMFFKWVDCTTYSKHQRKIPRSFKTKIGDCVIITIISNHISYKNEWIFNCHQLGLENKRLGSDIKTAEDAAITAITLCQNKIIDIVNSFGMELKIS